MDVIETLLKLPESERQKLLLLLTNAKTTNPSNDSVGPSGTDLKDSINLSSSTSEKPEPKQKTLDSWIVKNKAPTSNCEKEVTNSKEIVPISEKGEGSSSCDLEEVSCTLRDQLSCSSSTSIEKSSKPEIVNKKNLRVLLNRQDCLESKQKSPEHSEFSFEKVAISPIEVKSPSKKHSHVPENSVKRIASPEKHSSTPPRSYNLRSARGVSDEKPSSETSNSLVISSENEDRDKNLRSVVKQKVKIKNSVGKDASPNSSTCLKGVKNDQKNDSSNDIMSKENKQNSECQMPSTVVSSELEKTSSGNNQVSVDNNMIIITDENPMLALVGKGKRKRFNKDKESKKLCVASTDQKSSPDKMKVNSKNAQSIPCKKVVKFNENPSVLSIEKTVELPVTTESTSPNQKQISTNDTDKSVSKLKKTVKRKDKNDLVSHEKTNLDSTPAKIKKKSLPNPEINSGINKNVVSQSEISDMQLESVTTSESRSKESAKETEESTKDENSITLVNADSKKITRNRDNKNKSMKAGKNSLLPDSEKTSKVNEEGNVNDDSTEISSKIFPSQNKVSSKETEELLTKEMDTGTLVNVDSKRISRKRGNENKSMKAAKKILLPDSKLASKNIDEDIIISNKISPSKNNELAQETEELIKDANAVIRINKSSKKKIRKTGGENENTMAAKNSLSSDLEQASKNDEEHSITSAEISSKNSPSQSKECSKETEELLIKDTNIATSENFGSKRTTRKRGTGNKNVVTTKNSLISDSEQLSKSSDKDVIISSSSKISSSQNNESTKETEQLIKHANTANPLNLSSNKKLRKTGSEIKNKLAVKNVLVPDGGKSSKNVKDSIASTEISTINSSKNSPSQSKECFKEAEELAIKDTNSSTSVNISSRRTTRNRGIGNKSVVTTKNSLISDSKEAFKNSDKDSITSVETSETDSSRNSPSVAKELSTEQTSSTNTTNEKSTLNSSNDELDSLNKMKELPDNQLQKSNTVSSNVNKSNGSNALKQQVNALKKTVKVPTNSRKQVKVSKDENQSSTLQSISDNLDIEMQNTDLNLKKNGSKKKVPSLKIKVVRDSSEEHLYVPTTKSKVSSSNSKVAQEPKHQLLKNLKGQKETVSVKNSKNVKESHSKKKINSLESQVDSTNLSPNDEVEKLNSNLVGESFVKNKLSKTKINKKASVKSTDKEKSFKEVESDSSSEKTESEHLSKKILDVQIKSNTFHSVEKSETCDNNTNLDNSVNTEMAQEMISEIPMDINDTSEGEKVEHDIIREMEEITEKEADFAVNNLNDTDVVATDFENSIEFDEQMKNNYLDFCKLKKVLEIIGISFKEFFENPEILNCLNSDLPDGAFKIHKCKSDSKISICMHESKKKMNILNKLKRKK